MQNNEDVTVSLNMPFNRACMLSRALEAIARCGKGQFKDMLELINPKLTFDQLEALEKILKVTVFPELSFNTHHRMGGEFVVDDCQNAWEAYQHLRREISWRSNGKDWRRDGRDWQNMWGVCYDDPFENNIIPGKFTTEINKNETSNV